MTLDWLAEQLPVPDFIKIDVEGKENDVLSGGSNLLTIKHPSIFCEVSPDPLSRLETTYKLKAAGYKRFNIKDKSWVETAVFSTLAMFKQ